VKVGFSGVSKTLQIPYFIKIRPVGIELLYREILKELKRKIVFSTQPRILDYRKQSAEGYKPKIRIGSAIMVMNVKVKKKEPKTSGRVKQGLCLFPPLMFDFRVGSTGLWI
jgi:hypothetical protein